MPADTPPKAAFKLATSNQHTRLILTVAPVEGASALAAEEIKQAAEKLKVTAPLDDKAISRACKDAASGNVEPVIIATGDPPVDGVDGSLIWSRKIEAPTEKGGRLSHYLGRSKQLIVARGEPLAKLVPEVPGTDGLDVFGKPVKAKKAVPFKAKPGVNVRQTEDIFFSEKDGMVRLTDGKIIVDEIFPVEGNLTFDVGNIDFPGAVIINGGVLDLFEVKSGASVHVGGLVEAANITADTDIEVAGGIAGKKKGVIRCGGSLAAKFLVNAEVYADKDVVVTTQIVTSQVMALGTVLVPQGAIAGGLVSALGGVDAETIGSESAVKTIVVAGINYKLADITKETAHIVSASKKELESILKELAAGKDDATVKGREKLAALAARKKELDDAIAAAEKRRTDEIDLTHELARPVVIVRKMLYPGSDIRLGDCRTVINDPVRGPAKLVADKNTETIRFLPLSG